MALKIGILTLPITDNYGGILQAVALYRTLHNQGHDVVLVYKKFYHKEVLWKNIIKNILIKMPFHDFKKIKTNYKLNKKKLDMKFFHRPFIEKEIFNISKDLCSKQNLENFVKKENFDAVIVGSDQVWRKQYINDIFYKSYFLDFVNGSKTKKIAYAASFGKDHWEGENDSDDISKLLKDFTAISTREKSGVDICKNTFAFSDATHVLDPTILMNKEFYIKEIILKYDVSKIQKNGLVTYVLDEEDEKKEIINFVKEKLEVNNIHHLKGFDSSKITYSVPEWLASFANADFVVTDSFHGMVFSIIFEKEFVVIGNHSRGLDRFISLLSLLGLKNRLVFDIKDLEGKELESIDYGKVRLILEDEKKKSLEFLMRALDDK